jgi:hypothetical protein
VGRGSAWSTPVAPQRPEQVAHLVERLATHPLDLGENLPRLFRVGREGPLAIRGELDHPSDPSARRQIKIRSQSGPLHLNRQLGGALASSLEQFGLRG